MVSLILKVQTPKLNAYNMYKQPSVTVIIPFKENLRYLFSSINSVFKQTYNNFKIIIIYDNESKDDLPKIKNFLRNKKKKYSKFVSVIVNKKNLGAGYSRNIGIKKSRSKYVAFLDADDLWYKKKLQIQIDFMEKNRQVFSHTAFYIMNEKDRILGSRDAKKIISFDELIESCDIGLSTVIIDRKFIMKNRYFFPKIKTKEDFVLWLKIAKNLKFIKGINKKLMFYRKSDNSLSSNKFLGLINGYKVYKNYMNYGKIRSLYHLFLLSINFLKKKL